jgi:hypothetical protein
MHHEAGVPPPPMTAHQSIQTAEGEPLLQFAMSPTAEGIDIYLYEQVIEPQLRSGAASSIGLVHAQYFCMQGRILIMGKKSY